MSSLRDNIDAKLDRLLAAYHAGDRRHAKLVWKLCALNYWIKTDF